MILPKRSRQHKAESDSYAILLYKLRDLGVFRNVTDNDYGIDFELEAVKDGAMTGRYIKIQVKSSEMLKVRKDKVPVVGGIKQSTLNYWIKLSYKTHVIAYAVNVTTEDIYLTQPIFWQATRLLDGTRKSKSLEFVPVEKENTDVAKILTAIWLLAPSLTDTLHCHKILLKSLEAYFKLYVDVFQYDYDSQVHEPDVFRSLLEACKVISWNINTNTEKVTLSEEEQAHLFIYEYWVKQGGGSYDEIPNFICQKPMKVVMPILLKCLSHYKKMVLQGKYYWRRNNTYYLRLVYELEIPEPLTSHDEILAFGYQVRMNGVARRDDFEMFIASIDEEYKND